MVQAWPGGQDIYNDSRDILIKGYVRNRWTGFRIGYINPDL